MAATSNFPEVDEVNIALVGEVGTGKSSFVHALKRFKSNIEAKGSEASVTSPTFKPECYPHPIEKNIKLWDLPGLGRAANPTTKAYCEQLNLNEYDAFLLFTKTRFTIGSLRLAAQFEAMKKPFFVIRTHIDEDVENERKTKPKKFNEGTMIDNIRKNIQEKLNDLNSVCGEQIFLISNVYLKKWDFERLYNEILDELPTKLSSCFRTMDWLPRAFAKLAVKRKLKDVKINESIYS